MKRAVLFGIVFVLCILVVPGQIYVSRGNFYDTFLKGNGENILLLFRDGTFFAITENLEHRVSFPWGYVFKERSPKDLILVIHNHMGISRWSDADKRIYYSLRKAGFRGCFLCRLGNGQIISIEED